MKRRENVATGFVNFPMDHPRFRATLEGGMLVKLVVCENEDSTPFGMCCGVSVTDVLSEVLSADDRRPRPESPANYENMDDLVTEQRLSNEWHAYHYPHYGDESIEGVERYMSRSYLASMVIGTTGWSGWDQRDNCYWACTVEDLTDDGQSLYQHMQRLYPGCDIHLLTFLDT